MKRPPIGYLIGIALVLAVAAFVLLAQFGVIRLDSVFFFLLGNILALVGLVIFAVIGGAFVGMLWAHRMLARREFTPLERSMMEAATEIRQVAQRLDDLERKLERRIEEMEADRARVWER